MIRAIIQDILSDLLGVSGITTISIPFLVDVNDVLKLVCTIGGGILVFVSIRYKMALFKDLKKKQAEEIESKKYFKK